MKVIEDMFGFILFITALISCFICICSAALSGNLLLLVIAALVVLYVLIACFILRGMMK